MSGLVYGRKTPVSQVQRYLIHVAKVVSCESNLCCTNIHTLTDSMCRLRQSLLDCNYYMTNRARCPRPAHIGCYLYVSARTAFGRHMSVAICICRPAPPSADTSRLYIESGYIWLPVISICHQFHLYGIVNRLR